VPEVELGVLDRMMLMGILPKEGNVATIRIVRKLREAASFSEEEHEMLHITFGENGAVKWEEPKGEDGKRVPHMKAIKIGVVMFADAIRALEKLDKDEMLTSDHMGLYEKFVERDTGDEEAKGPQKVVEKV